MRAMMVVAMGVALAGCAGPADRNAQPNAIQRAKVLSSNDASITIEHSEWGRPIAFRLAEEHCAKAKKSAVYRGGVMQMGHDMTSTWRCE
jgi:hypothetical protein